MLKNFLLNPKVRLFFSALGALDASYLTWEHFAKASVFCLTANSCDSVLSSAYATIGSLPVSALGILYYGILFALSVYFFRSHDERVAPIFFYMTSAGLAASAIFVFLQFFVIHAICPYCMLSAATTLILFSAGLIQLRVLEAEPQKI